VWLIGHIFGFSPQDLWEMTMEDLSFWVEGAEQVGKWTKGR